MMNTSITETIDTAREEPISIETGKLAKQADGSVVVRMGNTMLLATVVSSKEPKDLPFLPLTVDYKEKFASTGKVPGGFIKREARPSEYEILNSRLVDRAIRPLFPDDYYAETQVLISLISAGKDHMPDALACLAASAAISVSDIPFNGPVSEVRVGRVDGEWKVNPKLSEAEKADLDIIVAGTEENIMMVEGEMKEVSEEEMTEALKIAHESIKEHCKAQKQLASQVPKAQQKREYDHQTDDEELRKHIHETTYDKFMEIVKGGYHDKKERSEAISKVKEAYLENMSEEAREEKGHLVGRYCGEVEKKAIRDAILKDGHRVDGRGPKDIREIWSEVDYLPGTHGSAIFTRGETQSLTTLTLGTKMDEQPIDGAVISGSEDFMLHYNFPPFCTGEAKPMRGTSRREVGHGNLALRALKAVIPPEKENPYTLRIVSDILESNGSSSMATVCAGSLALMDAGVQVPKAVSGIAMGLVMDDDGNYAILSDILGDEDHVGDMDFKVTGTKDGMTACQMDIKVDGLSYEIMAEALTQAKEGRLHILNEMNRTIDAPREEHKPHAPRIVALDIPKDMIGSVIGPGGKIIQELQEETDTTITIDEVEDMGRVEIASSNKEDIDRALKKIKDIAFPPTIEVGQNYEGTVKTIMPYGAFVELLPGQDALLHISEIAWEHVDKVEDHFKEGDTVEVKVKGKDPKTGKLKLTRKELLPKPEKKPE